MWDEIFKLAMSNGLWAVLFCMLLFYQLKDSKKREAKYNDVITSLTNSLQCVVRMEERIGHIDDNIQFLTASAIKPPRKPRPKSDNAFQSDN